MPIARISAVRSSVLLSTHLGLEVYLQPTTTSSALSTLLDFPPQSQELLFYLLQVTVQPVSENTASAFDITRQPLVFPVSRSAALAKMAKLYDWRRHKSISTRIGSGVNIDPCERDIPWTSSVLLKYHAWSSAWTSSDSNVNMSSLLVVVLKAR